MQDDIREQLIKQFPSDVVEILDQSGKPYYGCPTCKRAVTVGTDKCPGCGQVLAWDHIRKENQKKGTMTAVLKFEVAGDFTKGDCRKCPLSYIAKEKNENDARQMNDQSFEGGPGGQNKPEGLSGGQGRVGP